MVAVFISHASEDPDWPAEAVQALAGRLRDAGAAVLLDSWRDAEIGQRQSDAAWRAWMLDGLDAATTVLCLGSPLYVERTRRQGSGAPRGRGVAFEFFHIEQRLYDEHQGRDGWVWMLLPEGAARASHVPRVLHGAVSEYRWPGDAGLMLAHVAGRRQGGGEVPVAVAPAMALPLAPARAAPPTATVAPPTGPAWASRHGVDEFGAWADLSFANENVTQRLRWIAPREFWMGSPEDEAERHKDEGPRHRVRLSEGFWLADTACTQALWRALVGDSPSHFSGAGDLPVERVSWHDVQGFLQRLQARLPAGSTAALPTEAEWEYACRAGTDTPFALGDSMSPARVNFDGNWPYAGGAKGEYRKRTVPVKALSANSWGLYQMHGNVWEWCADGLRPYLGGTSSGAVVINPIGPQQRGPEAPRAVRGGSWISPAGNARSAHRRDYRRDDRSHALGFRFALRSTGPGGPGSR